MGISRLSKEKITKLVKEKNALIIKNKNIRFGIICKKKAIAVSEMD